MSVHGVATNVHGTDTNVHGIAESVLGEDKIVPGDVKSILEYDKSVHAIYTSALGVDVSVPGDATKEKNGPHSQESGQISRGSSRRSWERQPKRQGALPRPERHWSLARQETVRSWVKKTGEPCPT